MKKTALLLTPFLFGLALLLSGLVIAQGTADDVAEDMAQDAVEEMAEDTTENMAQAVEYIAGRDYDVIVPPLRDTSTDKIEVVEFFAYNCIHCYNFEPLVEEWKNRMPEHAEFVGSPAIWNAAMEPYARAYYTALALDVLDRVHGDMFSTIHLERRRVSSQPEIRQLFQDAGISPKKFDRTFNSFGVSNQVRRALARQRDAGVIGTPELMVAGKYRITTQKSASQAEMFKIVDFLVEKERAERE